MADKAEECGFDTIFVMDGWFEDEHKGLGFECGTLAERFEKLTEALAILKPTLRDERPSFSGKQCRASSRRGHFDTVGRSRADRKSKGSFEVREPRVMTNPRGLPGWGDRRRTRRGMMPRWRTATTIV
jgi:alkanesulfonate monooxygenase SsuD/methylene tetrahydromethanopterin reductase-like flavin-dependent oxidoreductase (luciferase family)